MVSRPYFSNWKRNRAATEGGFDPDPTRGPSMDRPSCESDLDSSSFSRSADEGSKKAGICKKQDKDGIILELDTPDHLPIGCERVMVCWQFRCKAAVGRPKRVS